MLYTTHLMKKYTNFRLFNNIPKLQLPLLGISYHNIGTQKRVNLLE